MCLCTGDEIATFIDENKIPSYDGELKYPFSAGWYYGNDEVGIIISDSDIKKWIKDACLYHKIPHSLLAVILQNENNPNASIGLQVLQFVERTAQTLVHVIDNKLPFSVPIETWNKAAKGASGIAKVSEKALLDAVGNSIEKYARPPVPSSVARTYFDISTDTRISGDDWRNDLYYAAAHIRYLIDREMNQECFNGELKCDDYKKLIAAYNVKGSKAQEYAESAIKKLKAAINKTNVLYFYEK